MEGYFMSEPRLEDMGDYNTLKGEKRKVVLAVILVSFIIGAIYVLIGNSYSDVDDQLETENTIKISPTGTVSIPVK
jgi:hypothetical protein